ncbi:MAG: sensor histidine kinase [Opitutales bacterium]
MPPSPDNPPEPSAGTSPESGPDPAYERLQRRLEAFVRLSARITFDVDLEHDRVFWTGGESLGYDPTTFGRQRHDWAALIHPDDLQLVRDAMDSARLQRKPLHYEARYRHERGHYRWFEVRGLFEYSAQGQATHLVGILEDITERRAQRQIAAERDRLVESNDALKEFVYAASHDLQEPLRTITAFVELLSEDYGRALDEEGREYLGFIRQASIRLQRLINDLLAYSRMDIQQEVVGEVDLDALLREALQNLFASIDASGARIAVGPLPLVQGEHSRLLLLFQNILANAIKFRRPGTIPEIRVEARDLRGEWHFIITDNGIGIPEDQQEKVFRIFHRLHAESEYEGTGMGLALCAKIVTRHGGRIWIDSAPGGGTEFHFTLPR